MPLTKEGYKQRSRRLVCASGDTRFWLVPANRIAHLTGMEIDSSAQSGLFGVITVDVRDSFQPISGSSGTQVRKSTAIKAGDVMSLSLDGQVQLLGGIDVRVNFSGPIVTLESAFR